ncbi:hypothetical protein JCM30471_32270 [Desulfuromonas carbonis]|uniref:ATP-binding cassette domain-containing protein n=1 Tax=Desulfuromonas sp. DDH964 TaxID=1823759 RepID=UPI00078C03D3|nr:ATP-binding cassette domain-containing protein [Desulfuromonas sp. DDH964]AMV71388.1 organic solvent tolerance ABC transporter ATP-binding protein [Desulfuromonas sp. DDH964]
MTDTLVLENLSGWEEIAPFNCRVPAGGMAVILTPKDEYNSDLARLLLGLVLPPQGRVELFEREPGRLNERDGRELRRRIGTVAAAGGLISNLKAWENLLLPTLYHRKLSRETLASAGRAALDRVGYQGQEMALPGLMNLFQRKQVGFARALLLDPDLMIYESLLFGLNQRERNLLLDIARSFHGEKAGRTSLFLTSDPGLPRLLPEAEVHYLTKGLQP